MESRDNSGALFKNDRKQSDKHPDYKGNATIGGQEFWLSAWIKKGKKGKFMSLAFTPKQQQRQQEEEDYSRQDEDDIPF